MNLHSFPKNILVIAAHPDDEVLGCGATLSKLTDNGFNTHVLILGEGLTSRQDSRNPEIIQKQIKSLHEEATKATSLVGATYCEVLSFPDNQFDSVPLIEIIKAIEQRILSFKPQVVFTHSAKDLNIDHRITCQATITACRPVSNCSVSQILAYEVLSSSHWVGSDLSSRFNPNTFIPVEKKDIDLKISAMETYKSEKRSSPHPRSPEIIKSLAQFRGSSIGVDYAESFELLAQNNYAFPGLF
jgi:LmbE family N-acetylglucosaminyl deacetylase